MAELHAENTIKIINSIQPYHILTSSHFIRINDKYIFLYYYALLNLLASLNMKKRDYQTSFDIYDQVEHLLQDKNSYNTEIEIEKAHLVDDIHIVKYNKANAALVALY
jgi:hypothetical protein